jgi:hypothetical protein
MKNIINFQLLLSPLILFIACEQIPLNPPKIPQNENTVYIEHINTEYIPVNPNIEGLIASKINLLFFNLKVENFTAKTIEIFGRAVLSGPPVEHEHGIHFRTDQVTYKPDETGYEFNEFDWIEPEKVYTLVRPKYPTNEYSPFQDMQGMILEIDVTEVWAYDEFGERIPVILKESIEPQN